MPPGSACGDVTVVCGGNSMCLNRVCACINAQVSINAQCQLAPPVAPGAPCDDFSRCLGGSSCIGARCTCPMGTIVQFGVCVVPPQVIQSFPTNPAGPTRRCMWPGPVVHRSERVRVEHMPVHAVDRVAPRPMSLTDQRAAGQLVHDAYLRVHGWQRVCEQRVRMRPTRTSRQWAMYHECDR